MNKQLYFIRQGQSNHHRNNLERIIAGELKRYDKVLTDDTGIIRQQMKEIVERCNRGQPRCKPTKFIFEKSFANSQDYRVTVMGLGGSTVWEGNVYAVIDQIMTPPPSKEQPAKTEPDETPAAWVGKQLTLL